MSLSLRFRSPPGEPIPRGIEHYWSVMLALDEGGPWTIAEVMVRCEGEVRSIVQAYVHRLVAAGTAQEAGERKIGRNVSMTYCLLQRPLRAPSLREDGSRTERGRMAAQMWTVMRGPLGRQGFAAADLVLYGSTDEVAVTEGSAKVYIVALAKAGYLVCVRPGRPKHPGQWKLRPSLNTGPLPPAILKTHVVYDRNRAVAIGPCEAEEALP